MGDKKGRKFPWKSVKIAGLVIVSLAVIAILARKHLGAFWYNELEFKSRVNLMMAYNLEERADYLVDLRTRRVDDPIPISEKERYELMDDIEDNYKQAEKLMKDYEEIAKKQKKIPWLPEKYKAYHAAKMDWLYTYQKLLKKKVRIKSIEYAVEKAARQLVQVQRAPAKFTDTNSGSFEERMTTLNHAVQTGQNLEKWAKEMYEDNLLTQGMYDYIQTEAQATSRVYQALQNYESLDKFEAEMTEISNLRSQQDTFELSEKWHQKVIDPIEDDISKLTEESNEKSQVASNYYDDNRLAWDAISAAINKVWKKYPKNYNVQ